MFIIACIPIKEVIPVASKLPNISGAFIAISIPLHINIPNKAITTAHPINPNSSANTANIKSLCGSDIYKYFCLLFPSPTPKIPPEPIAYRLCIICHPSSCAYAQGFRNDTILVNLYPPLLKNFAKTYSPTPLAVPPKTPNVKKCDILQPATIIITDTTATITSEALRCDCTPNKTPTIGSTKNTIGFINPFNKSFNSSLCFVRYAAKNTIIPILVISDGWNDETIGTFFIQRLAPFTSLPKAWH